MTGSERRIWVCPACASGGFQPFSCGGPHYILKKNGEYGKRRVYRWVEAVEVRPIDRDRPYRWVEEAA